MENTNDLKKVLFIYNPSSGETSVKDHLDDVINVYQDNGYQIIPHRLVFNKTELNITNNMNGDYHHILIAGGDGTINYVVNLLKQKSRDIPIGILPTGTANDFANMLNIHSSGLKKLCKATLMGEITPVDLGRVNGTYFTNVFSCGLFTDVSQKTPTIMKNTFGKLAYYMGGISELPRFRKMQLKIETDAGNYEGGCVIFFVFNGCTAGKFKIAYQSRIDDGLLDVLIIKADNLIETFQSAVHFLKTGNINREYPPGIVYIRCSRLVATCETNEPTDVDGQAGPVFPLNITCEKGAIRVLRPAIQRKPKKNNANEEI
jgi:YegS/Rv2252/BmrU family lipid kinase